MSEEQKQTYGMVFYGDGGFTPSTGLGGVGGHGYIFPTPIDSPKVVKNIDATTDKGYLTKAFVEEGHAKAVKPETYLDVSISLMEDATNNVAELQSALTALKYINENEKIFSQCHFLMDSKYVLDGVESWHKKWEKNNWTKSDGYTPVANKDLWINLLSEKRKAEAAGTNLSWEWVKGHSGVLGNEFADDHATRAIFAARKGDPIAWINESPGQGYRKYNNVRNRLLGHAHWYYESCGGVRSMTESGHTVYLGGDHGDDDALFGKKMAATSISVAYLTEPVEIMEIIRQAQHEHCHTDDNVVVDVSLDALFKPRVFDDITRNKDLFISKPFVHQDLYTYDAIQLTRAVNPPKLADFALASLAALEQKLLAVMNNQPGGFCITDITSVFYVKEMNKKEKEVTELNKDIKPSTKALDVDGIYLIDQEGEHRSKFNLTFGLDIPRRNMFSALKELNPKVWLVVGSSSGIAYNFSVVIKAGDDWLAWSATHSNIKLISGESDETAK